MSKTEFDKECPKCAGLGHLDYPFVKCNICNGTGRVKMTPDEIQELKDIHLEDKQEENREREVK